MTYSDRTVSMHASRSQAVCQRDDEVATFLEIRK